MPKDFPPIYGAGKAALCVTTDEDVNLYLHSSDEVFENMRSSFGIALHMHQPTIPASSADISTAELISNLQFMMEHQNIGDNHNAPIFMWCYSRIADFVRELCNQGKSPRVMLDYSGNLLWGLQQMGAEKTLNNLKIKCTPGEISKWILREPHSVSRIVSRMENIAPRTRSVAGRT